MRTNGESCSVLLMGPSQGISKQLVTQLTGISPERDTFESLEVERSQYKYMQYKAIGHTEFTSTNIGPQLLKSTYRAEHLKQDILYVVFDLQDKRSAAGDIQAVQREINRTFLTGNDIKNTVLVGVKSTSANHRQSSQEAKKLASLYGIPYKEVNTLDANSIKSFKDFESRLITQIDVDKKIQILIDILPTLKNDKYKQALDSIITELEVIKKTFITNPKNARDSLNNSVNLRGNLKTLESCSVIASILNAISYIFSCINPYRRQSYNRNIAQNGNPFLFWTNGNKQKAEAAIYKTEVMIEQELNFRAGN